MHRELLKAFPQVIRVGDERPHHPQVYWLKPHGQCLSTALQAAQCARSWLQRLTEGRSVLLWAKNISGGGRNLGWDRLSGARFGAQACFSPGTARAALRAVAHRCHQSTKRL